MRCDEVIRELAVPTDDRDSATLSEHLANCPSCTGWAKRAGQLDRLWDVTRPAEPLPEVWDTVWAHVSCALDSGTPAEVMAFSLPTASSNGSMAKANAPIVPTPSSARSRVLNWGAIGLIGLAQAAAILLAVGLTWHRSSDSPQPAIAGVKVSPSLIAEQPSPVMASGFRPISVVEIEGGQQIVIYVTGSEAKIIDLTPQESPSKVKESLRNLVFPLADEWYVMFNEAESMTKPTVAMKE